MNSEITQQLIKTDFLSFIFKCFKTVNPATEYMNNWHIHLISEYLQACEKREIKRLIINIPPRHLKSLMVNVAWPAWLLANNPATRIISASYSQALATKHSLDSRLILSSEWYQRNFPKTKLVKDQNQKDKFVTTKRGFRLATSVGGTLTGEGGDFLILDDPHNPANINSQTIRENTLSWYDQVFSSRLDDKKNGVIVLIMQRLHHEDLTGYLLEKNPQAWESLVIPAFSTGGNIYQSPLTKKIFLFPENSALQDKKENITILKKIEDEMGSFAYAAQYLQNPLPTDNGIIKRDWLKYYKVNPDKFSLIVQSWDTAIKTGRNNDYSVCTTWGESENCYYLLDLLRDKLDYPSLKRTIISFAEKWKPNTILIEDKASGGSIIQDIIAETKLPIISQNPKLDKSARLISVCSLIEAGKVRFPEKARFLTDLEIELLCFPTAPHDDIVDSITQYLIWAKNRANFTPRIRGF